MLRAWYAGFSEKFKKCQKRKIMTENTGKMKEILCRTLGNDIGIYMSAENGASRFLGEINRFFRHEFVFENRISGSHCFPAPIMIMNPLTAFSSDFRHTGAVPAYHGAIGIAVGIPKSSSSSGVVPFVTMLLSILIGLRHFNFAVRMTVIISETFFLPCSVLVPNVRRLKITEFLKPCSALLFVGSTIPGYLRNVKSSFLWVTSRLRIVSASLWEIGFLYSSLNLFKMPFFSEHHCSGERLENIL